MAAQHTPECTAYITTIDAVITAFDTKYPNHCRSCEGSGMLGWDDPDVGIFNAVDPCTFCEAKPTDAVCALCGQPGDFSGRTLDQDEHDTRPCGCPVTEYRPVNEGCLCFAGLADLPDTHGADRDQDDDEITDIEAEYDYHADDMAFDAYREQQATRSTRGRD